MIEIQEKEQTLQEAKQKEDEKERLRIILENLLKVTQLNKQLQAELNAGNDDDAETELVADDPNDEDYATGSDDPRMLHYDYTRDRVYI